jgi:NADH-quinone oxidoreductase subunit D
LSRNDETTVALGLTAGELDNSEVVIPVGPRQPALHGALRIAVTLDGEQIVRARPLIGYLHRGVEKLFEVRDYRQIIVLANRHDWLSAFASELAVAHAVERLMGLEVPPRAVWMRTLLAELNRALHHLAHIGGDPLDTADATGIDAAVTAREQLQHVMEEYTGGRVHFMATRIGGLKDDAPDGWIDRVTAAIADVHARLPNIAPLISGEAAERLQGLGTVDAATVSAYGMSGPVARASGVAFDLRRDEPYAAYADLDVSVVTRTAGDCRARFECLVEEIAVSLGLATQCIEQLRDLPGPIAARVPPTVRAPVGHAYAWTENPSGINGYYLVSRGDRTPWRLKLRTASFNNVQALESVLPGCRVDDLVAVLASFLLVTGDLDK